MRSKLLHIPISLWLIIIIGLFFISYKEIKSAGKKDQFQVVRSDALFYHEYVIVYIFGKDPYFPRETTPINRYTMGMAITYMPAISVGYVVTELMGIDHNSGKNHIYKHLLFYLGLLYTMAGLIFIRMILKRWFNEMTISMVIVLIFFGTNLYYYNINEPIMAHPVSFFLVTAFVYFSLQWIKKPTVKTALLAGAILGLTTLIRPTNALIILVPVVYILFKTPGNISIKEFKMSHWLQILLAGFLSVLIFFPQLFYWHYYTGVWFNYSYGKEGFFFDKPAILQVLFSFRKGWFIYTPVMLLIIPGAVFCFKENKPVFWAVIIFFVLNLYIISSWWCWWYGGSFGMRSLIDSYGILSIFIAYAISHLLKSKKWVIGSVGLILVFLIYVNLYQTRQARICRIHYDSMTYAAYKKVFLTDELHLTKEEWEAMLDAPDYESALEGKRFW